MAGGDTGGGTGVWHGPGAGGGGDGAELALLPQPEPPQAGPGRARTDPSGAGGARGGSRLIPGVTGDHHPHPPLPRRLPPLPDQPSIGERGCPERRLWLEGTPAELGCAATGNPPPRVTCAKLGDSRDTATATPNATRAELGDSRDPPQATANVTRAHAGTYQCRATNAHGSAVRNVTVAVECECGE